MAQKKVCFATLHGVLSFSDEGDNPVNMLEKQLKKISKIKPEIVYIEINSPGGTVAASEHIYNELMALREKGTEIIVLMQDFAASGGLMVSMAANRIFAYNGTLTGSIGVIMSHWALKDIAEKMGIGQTVIKAGEFKDVGNPFRDMTEEESVLLREIVTESHSDFIEIVAKGRDLSKETVNCFADGRVLTGRQALNYKLIDNLGGRRAALDEIAKMVGVKVEKLNMIDVRSRPGLFSSFKKILPWNKLGIYPSIELR